jgi:hypothetical protein
MATDARVSQVVVESLDSADAAARVSQVVAEPLVTGDPNARVSQVVAEPLVRGDANARVSQVVAEPLIRGTANARVSQLVVEVLCLQLEVPMPPVFPTLIGLGYNVKWSPVFYNMPTDTAATGADVDLGLADEPLHDFELTYGFLRDQFGNTEFKTMMGFFLRLGGTRGRFLFPNPDDRSVTGQFLVTTDGVNSVFGPLKRTFGIGDNSGTEAVGWVDQTEPFNLYWNGVLQDPATYQILGDLPKNQQIKFLNTPAADIEVTVDMSYFYYCKFPDNTNTFEKFLDRIWLLNKMTLHSCRAGT